jgi:L-lysine epsilon oxidase-like protein
MHRRQVLTYAIYGLAASALPVRRATAARVNLEIVSCVIHPAIGVCRLGNSPDGFFVGPEVPGHHPLPRRGFKDVEGRVLRQAARFRVFGLNRDGEVIIELTADVAEITWRVHLANKKSAWYTFSQAFDVPESIDGIPERGVPPLVVGLRNPHVIGEDRRQLVIDPGPREIRGRNVNPDGAESRYRFDTGRFTSVVVPLGELRTDERGHLLVLGGHGTSGTPLPDNPANSAANNTLWYDDTSDGPVDAIVRIGRRTLQAEGAWVVVAPPNYAPGITSSVTMYDVIHQVSARGGPKATRPSFSRQIFPLLERHVRQQWVNLGIFIDSGWGASDDFTQPDMLRLLASPSPRCRALRTAVFARFRDPASVERRPGLLPPYYGDVIDLPPSSPRFDMALLPAQYEWLRQWADGDFEDDWPVEGVRFPESLEEIPLADRPAALDRAALDECLGGPFDPGYELTWTMRSPLMYAAPFRLRRRQGLEPDWGDSLDAPRALAPDGPLSASGPGDLTRWLAVPWQTDTALCRFALDRSEGSYLPTFWPARVPNHVLARANYDVVMRRWAPLPERQAAFRARQLWLSPSGVEGVFKFINEFIVGWGKQGIVTARPGPGDPDFPDHFWVQEGTEVFESEG